MTSPRLKLSCLVVFLAWTSIAFLLNNRAIRSTDSAESVLSFIPETIQGRREVFRLALTYNQTQAPWETHLPEVCSILPGEGTEEGGRMGYQVLYRLHYFFQQTPISRTDEHALLCVWIAENNATKETDGFLLQTLRGKCDGFLQIYMTLQGAAISQQSDNNLHRIHIPATTDGLQAVFAFISELSQYRWFHWLDPNRSYFVPENFFYILQSNQISNHDQPLVVQSWILQNAETNREYRELFGSDPMKAPGCDRPRAGNQPTAKLLQHCSHVLKGSDFLAVQNWISSCLSGAPASCLRPNKARDRQEKWAHLRRYSEITLPSAWEVLATQPQKPFDTVISLIRVHSILHGACDKFWKKVLGALDEYGNPGYVHDPYYIKKHPQAFNYHVSDEPKGVCEIPFGEGDEGKYGYQGLKKIEIATAHQNQKQVLCMVYTQSNGHSRLQAIAETWAPRCDGFFAASNLTDTSIGAVHLLHEGPEIYDNMWMKVRAMFHYAYDHYLNDFDLFHIGGDDHYLIPENLRFTAATGSWKGPWDDAMPLLLGGSLALKKRRYCNGGSGYTINRAALRLLVEELFDHPTCMPHWRASYEDRLASSCFRSAGVLCTDTNDDRNETRYHTWNADQHAAWSKEKPAQDWKKLVEQHGIAWKEGLGQISQTSVSFHLKNPGSTSLDSGMRRYHAILYNLCNLTRSTDLSR